MNLALYQPEIPQNTGTLIRLGACLNVKIDIIGPCGFILNNKLMQRAGMDYIDIANYNYYNYWDDFKTVCYKRESRMILLSPNASTTYYNYTFAKNDTLLLGQESKGFPDEIYNTTNEQLLIPMVKNRRSLNIAIAASLVLGEALRQTNLFPK